MKRAVRVLALGLAMTILAGCGNVVEEFLPVKQEAASSQVVSIIESQTSAAEKAKFQVVQQRNDERALPNAQCRKLYEKLVEGSAKISDQKGDNGYLLQAATLYTTKLTDAEVQQTVLAFFNDNPQIFWISNQYAYSFTLSGTSVQLYSRLSSAACTEKQRELEKAVQKIIAAVPANSSEFQREQKIFEGLADRCTYDDNAVPTSAQQTNWQPYTAYGALVTGRAVCDGYARAMQLLAGRVGLKCRLVNGNSKGAPHIWNLIQIDQKWYHFDATWMDGNFRTYDYFNVTDAVIRRDHTISPVNGAVADCNFPLPAANSEDANYYRRMAIPVPSLNSQTKKTLVAALRKAAQTQKASLALRISPDLPYDDTVNRLFNRTPYFFQTCVQAANRDLPKAQRLSYTMMKYSTDAMQHGVSVQLVYAGS